MVLNSDQSTALAAIVSEPMKLSSDWETKGHRRQLFFFTNEASGLRVRVATVATLGALGLVELHDDAADPEALIAKPTPLGEHLARQAA